MKTKPFKPLFAGVAVAFVLLSCATAAHAAVKTRIVDYEYEGTKMKGYLAWDDAVKGPRPAVVVIHDFWGLNDYARRRANQLAETGYAAFAADMYGEGRVGKHPEDARAMMAAVRQNIATWRGRANAALAALRKQPETDSAKVAAIGYCFGGATVLQMLYSGADLKAVVSFHGALMPADSTDAISKNAKILILHGADDPHVPPEAVKKFKDSLDAAKIPYAFVAYPGAVHSFTVKEAGDDPSKGSAYNAAADRLSWEEMSKLFRDALK